jgi:hypothetical protein
VITEVSSGLAQRHDLSVRGGIVVGEVAIPSSSQPRCPAHTTTAPTGTSPASSARWAQRSASSIQSSSEKAGGPAGVLIYQSGGAGKPLTGQLLNEGFLNIVLALFAASLLSLASGLTSYVARVGFVTLLGVPVALMSNVESWNWYGYPLNYTAATILENLIGFLVVGLVAAAFVKPAGQRITAVPAKAA